MPTVLAVMAHPDDIEITCAGTLALLARAGWRVHMATMTAGDLGSRTIARGDLADPAAGGSRRRPRCSAPATRASGSPTRRSRTTRVTKRQRHRGSLREVRPDLLIRTPRLDYMADHEETLTHRARSGIRVAPIPNWRACLQRRSPSPVDVRRKMPVDPYADPAGPCRSCRTARSRPLRGGHHLGHREKEKMLAAHASQRTWLREQHGEDEYLHWMRRQGATGRPTSGEDSVEVCRRVPALTWAHGYPNRTS